MSGKSEASLAHVYVVSVLSACNAEIVTFPFDLVKTRLQVQGEQGTIGQGPYKGMTRTGIEVVQKSGFFKLWEGISAMFLRHSLYSGIRLVVYQHARDVITKNSKDNQFTVLHSILCGVVSGGIGQYVANPADLVKVQMQMEGKRRMMGLPPRNRGLVDAFVKIWNAGGIVGLWQGAIPNVARACLVTVGDISAYDISKRFLLRSTPLKDDWITHSISSFIAGLSAAILCTPADVIKSRVMNQPVDEKGRGLTYQGPMDCVKKTLMNEGLFALYKGFLPMWIRLGPWAITFWLTYEQIMKLSRIESF